jgi:hypothetical protein
MTFKRYLWVFCIISLVPIFLTVGLNWFINPYDIYNSPRVSGLNYLKPEVNNHERLYKAYAIIKVKPKAICLGTSRAEIGVSPGHQGWAYHPVYNLGLTSANVYELLRYFQHTNAIQPLRQVLLTLDFFNFGIDSKNVPGFEESRLAVSYDNEPNAFSGFSDFSAILLSRDAISDSINTIKSQNTSVAEFIDGQRIYAKQNSLQQGGFHDMFMSSAKASYEIYRTENYQFDTANPDKSPFTYFRNILQIAYRDNIDLRMTISPCHVRQWEILAVTGKYQQWEEWKRYLVSSNEEEAKRFEVAPFPLWDFSGYNEYTTEAVPTAEDTTSIMRWYWDSSHYTKELGDLMLDKIFNYHESERVVSKDFGVLVNSQNIEQNLSIIRSGRQEYRDTHPDDINEIESVIK